jgi:hypothetical protein
MWRLVCLLLIGAMFVCCNSTSSADQETPNSVGDTIAYTLPTPAELPGFSEARISRLPPPQTVAWLFIKRNADEMRLTVEITSASTPKKTKELSRDLISPPGGIMPEGSPSKRKIGQKVWQSRYTQGGPPRGTFTLIAWDGRSIVRVQMMHLVRRLDNSGNPLVQVFSQNDLRFAEDLALQTLERLTVAGLTSRPANTASDLAKQQMSMRQQEHFRRQETPKP